METVWLVCLAYLEAGLRLTNLWACLLVSLGYFTEVNFLPRYSNHLYIIGHNTTQITASLPKVISESITPMPLTCMDLSIFECQSLWYYQFFCITLSFSM